MLKISDLIQLTTFSFLLLLGGQLCAQGINFEKGTWKEIVAKAQKENKPIFVDAYTTWCGPCQWMAKNVFVKEEIGTYFNENFIAYKIDVEKGEGPAFAKANRVTSYPTLLYFDPNGEMIHKGIGARDADDLIALCKDAMNTNKQLAGFIENYRNGRKDQKFLKAYLTVLVNCGENTEEPFRELWNELSDNDRQIAEVFELMVESSTNFRDIKDPLTIYFLENRAAYREIANNNDLVDEYLTICYMTTIWKIACLEDKKEEKTLIKEVLARFPKAKKEFKKRLIYMETTMEAPIDEAKIQKAHIQYLKVSSDVNELNSAAWDVYEKQDDFKVLKQALSWVDRAIDIKTNYFSLDTKAALLYKMKNYEEAKIYAEKAIREAKEEGMVEVAEETTMELLENINVELRKTANASK